MTKQDIIKHLKPLRWNSHLGDGFIATTPIGFYTISERGGEFVWEAMGAWKEEKGFTGTLINAKAACQQHYEETIISCFNLE